MNKTIKETIKGIFSLLWGIIQIWLIMLLIIFIYGLVVWIINI